MIFTKGRNRTPFFLFFHLWPTSNKTLSHMLAFPPGLGVWLLDSKNLCARKVMLSMLSTVTQRQMPKQLIWTTRVGQLLDYPIEIQRLMGSRTLFVMEVHNRQQGSLKAHDITENCFTYGTPYVLWLSHFRNLSIDENHWTINWCLQHLVSYIHSRTCSLYPIKKGKHDKIMDSFWQQLYTLISYYFYFRSSH